MMKNKVKAPSKRPPLRLSLRYKVALPVLILVTLMLFLLFQTTFLFVRNLVLERYEQRLLVISEVFRESLKVPLILRNQEVLEATLRWMADRPDVVEVRVENDTGESIGSTRLRPQELPYPLRDPNYEGAVRIDHQNYGVATPIKVGDRQLGRLLIVFSQMGLEDELRQIFMERMLLAFSLGIGLALLTAGVTWLALRPLFKLQRTVQQILRGNLNARAKIHSFDEIEDLAEAFNEMLARLSRTLDNLQARTHALEESEERYRLIVENANDIIFTLTPEGEFVFLNEGFSGCSREEIKEGGLAFFRELHAEETYARFEEGLKKVRETRESVINLATTHLHQEINAEIFYLTNLTPLVGYEGDVKLIQGVMRDVTEWRRIELMKESLIRDVAHELKTPTAKFEMAVHWFEEEMNKDEGLRKHAKVIEMLKGNADRLMRTINSIMDLSKLESGMQQITKKTIELNELLAQVLQDMEPLSHAKGLQLVNSLSREPLTVSGDRDMLYRLFVNLISNAIKYTPEGTIEVSSGRSDGNVLAEVRDTGMGIAEEDLKIIFDRFVQKTAASVGIGVGLTISRDIAVLHGAKVWAESPGLGKGAVFKVKF